MRVPASVRPNMGVRRNKSFQFKALQMSGVCGFALALGAAGGAFAQEGGAQPTQVAQVDDVVQVTGSRIRRSGMSTPTPVTVIQADELQTIAPTNLIDALDQLPQFVNNASPSTAASKGDSAGASNVNLRGVGSKRTLVLLNGHRVVPSNRLGNVDINVFPEALIERVETVTGGASAAYGTDAVAGVVNFILDDDYEGIKGHVQYGITDRNDNENYEISLTGGAALGSRAHIVASADWFESDRIDNLDGRDWWNGTGLVTNPAWNASRTAPQYLVLPNVKSTLYTTGGTIYAPGTSIHDLFFQPDGSTTPFIYGSPASIGRGTQSMAGGSGYNAYEFDTSVSTENFPDGTRSGSFVPDSKRGSAFVNLTYELSDSVELYVNGLYGYNYANSVGTLPLGHQRYAYTIYSGNPFLPADIQSAMTAEGISSFRLDRYHTAADIAQDRMILTNDTYSFSGGFNAELGGVLTGWALDGYYQYGRNDNQLLFTGFQRRDRTAMAVDAVLDGSGNIVCNVNVVNPGASRWDGCVPLNLLGAGRASAAAVDWITEGDSYVQAKTEQHMVELAANGEVFDGWGAGAISLAVGGSYREQSIDHDFGPDAIDALDTPMNDPALGIRGIPGDDEGQDDVTDGVDLSDYTGDFDVKEVFAETLIPLISGQPGMEQLNASLAARYADYAGSGGIWAWKAGLDWQVTTDLRLRGTVSRDVRAGSLEERFDQQGQATGLQDPELDGLSYTAFQIRGGNPNVAPEEADTITVGGVYQPSYIPGLSLSVDYYSIEINDAIELLGVQRIIDDCFDGDAELCGRITRDAGTNRITNVQNIYTNLGSAKNEGIDFEAIYTTDISLLGGDESLTGRFLATHLLENSTTTDTGTTRDTTGEIVSADLDWRSTLGLTYRNGPFSLYMQGRYLSGGIVDIDYVEGVDIMNNHQGSVIYTDARVAYDFEAFNNTGFQVFLNVTNLLDRDPPLVPTWSSFSGSGFGTNEGLYDTLGRRFVAGLRFEY